MDAKFWRFDHSGERAHEIDGVEERLATQRDVVDDVHVALVRTTRVALLVPATARRQQVKLDARREVGHVDRREGAVAPGGTGAQCTQWPQVYFQHVVRPTSELHSEQVVHWNHAAITIISYREWAQKIQK